MSNAIAAAAVPMDTGNRRLAGGLLVSLLLHAVVLLLQFGIPGLRPGPDGPLSVRLAPAPQAGVLNPLPLPLPAVTPALPAVAAPTSDVPVATAAPLPPLPLPPSPVAAPSQPRAGFTLVDPARPEPSPAPAPAPRTVVPHRTARRRARAPIARDGLHTEVIAQDQHRDAGFSVPPTAGEPAPDPEPLARTEPPEASASALEPAQSDEQAQQDERARLAEQRAQERERAQQARRDADEQALRAAVDAEAKRAAEQQARILAEQDVRYQDELARRQRQAAEETRLAEEAQRQAAARQLAEQQRIQAEQARAQQLAEQQRIQAEQARAQQLAEQQRIQAEQATAQQLAEQQRIQVEQARAQQLAEQQRIQAEQARAQQLAEQQRIQVEQARAQQLAAQRAAEERRRELQVRQQAEQLAREQAEQAARLAQQAQARRPQDQGDDAGGSMRAGPVGAIAGEGPGNGNGGAGRGDPLPGGTQGGSMVSRARELLRGIDIDKPVPPLMRPAEDARRAGRRALADAVLRDVPLRMYIDSVRQKIERNAVVGPALLAEDVVRVFPLVSIAIRSDGSIDDVTIVRSSGRADVDEIVRRIVRLNARYAAFPPNVAANYDVVELRRVWSFSGVLRLLEEMR
jgi:hypothetical protein